MKLSSRNNIKGKLHETKGSIKAVTGKLVNNPTLEVKGQAEKISGKAQQKIGEAEKTLGK